MLRIYEGARVCMCVCVWKVGVIKLSVGIYCRNQSIPFARRAYNPSDWGESVLIITKNMCYCLYMKKIRSGINHVVLVRAYCDRCKQLRLFHEVRRGAQDDNSL